MGVYFNDNYHCPVTFLSLIFHERVYDFHDAVSQGLIYVCLVQYDVASSMKVCLGYFYAILRISEANLQSEVNFHSFSFDKLSLQNRFDFSLSRFQKYQRIVYCVVSWVQRYFLQIPFDGLLFGNTDLCILCIIGWPFLVQRITTSNLMMYVFFLVSSNQTLFPCWLLHSLTIVSDMTHMIVSSVEALLTGHTTERIAPCVLLQ